MDISFLLNADPPILAQHFRTSAVRSSATEITKDLLASIDNESLPSRIFITWLSAGGDCEAVRQGISFQNSQTVRRASIARFGRFFRTTRVVDVWNAVGGTAGIVEYLSTASIRDVKSFCHQIGSSATAEVSAGTRAALVDELYKALRITTTAESDLNTPDQRPLSDLYNVIFPACSQKMILSVVDGHLDVEDVRNGELAYFARPALFRSRFISELQDPSIDVDLQRLRALLNVASNDRWPNRRPGLTANTKFAVEVLEILSMSKSLNGDANVILSDIATPLFRRLARRKCLPETIARATRAYVAFAKQHTSNRMSLRDLLSGPGVCLIKNWGRCPDHLEASLMAYIRLAPSSHLPMNREYVKLVRLVPIPLRIRLLGIVLRCDLVAGRGLEQTELYWDSSLLLALPRAEAQQILQRLIKRGAESLNQHQSEDLRRGETDILMVKLTKDESNRLELASAATEEQKQKASQTREQSSRAVCISMALRLAAASLSLDLYGQTLLWTRKYIKDPLTAMHISRYVSLSSRDCPELLCGFPETQRDCALLTKDRIASNVQQANIIIIQCLETACQAQREPGFKSYHWDGVLELMSTVVAKRHKHVNMLQDTLSLSDDEVFETIWHDTLEACMALEALGLHNENTSLRFNKLGGPLMEDIAGLLVLTDARPATLRFLDTLAEARNGFWEIYRRKHVPDTMTLVAPYPRGLPLECLVLFDLSKCEAGTHLPYLLSRAEQVVFIPRDVALAPQPASEDDITAIGAFVENWQVCLSVYVSLSRNRQEAALAAWKHATGPLSATRMSDLEAQVFWSGIFTDSLQFKHLRGPWTQRSAQPPPPRIPASQDEQPIEWSPEASAKEFEVKAYRRLEPVRLDAMINAYRNTHKTLDSEYVIDTHSEVPRHTLGSFWYRWGDAGAAAPAVREALVAAAMLHISEANSLSPGVLSKPFPMGKDSRFPALFLDGDFLEREDPKRNIFVWDTMKRLCDDFPVTLLVQMSRSLIEASISGQKQAPAHALKLLCILIKGDRPQMALDLIQQLILNRPDDSSWQRMILTKGLLNALPKRTVEHFLRELNAAMQLRLSEHANKSSTSTQTSPHIKITTVKLLAQLLSGATFVAEAFASSVLIDILSSTSHIDVRVSVMESLVDVLQTSKDKTIRNDILAAFEAHLIPVMAGMNERVPMSKEEWMACNSNNLPKLYGLAWGDLPPILSCMVASVSRVNDSMKQQLFDRILIPTLMKSCDTNGRWMQLFLESHGISLSTDSLPDAPTQLQLLVEMLKWPAFIPASVVDLWLEILTVVLNPPSGIAAMNKLIRDDSQLLDSNNGQHWLALWGTTAEKILLRRTKPASMLVKDWLPVREDGLTISHIQAVVLQQFDRMLPLYHPARGSKTWKPFIDDLQPVAWTSKDLNLWHRNVKPLLQQMVDKVEPLRTLEWQRNPNRFPAELPDTFLWRLWLLTPALEFEDRRNDDIKLLAVSISGLLEELGKSPRSYIRRYEAVAEFILANGTTTDWAKLTLIFGDLDGVDCGRLDTVQDLKIDLTRQLLETGRNTPPPTWELRREVRKMVRSLTNCNDEAIRNVGLKLCQDRKSSNSWSDEKTWYAEGRTG